MCEGIAKLDELMLSSSVKGLPELVDGGGVCLFRAQRKLYRKGCGRGRAKALSLFYLSTGQLNLYGL